MSIAHKEELKQLPEAILAETSAWMARLHSADRNRQVEEGFRRWLNSDPRHARAFECMTDIWSTVSELPAGRFSRVGPRSGAFMQRSRAPLEPRRWVLAAAAIATLAVGAMGYWRMHSPTYETDIGAQRTVELRDGSRMILNSDTRVKVAYTDHAREIHLQKGEAQFDVLGNPRRPFTVVAGDRRITALGTSFIVRYDAQRTAVTLMQGRVEITGSPQPADRSSPAERLTLSPGERFVVLARSTREVDRPSIEAVTAWRRKEVIFDHTPLTEAVAEMNRYESTPIVLDVPHEMQMQISGNYRTGEGLSFAKSIAGLYGLEVRDSKEAIHIGRLAPGSSGSAAP
jgi:transmembrane sensor